MAKPQKKPKRKRRDLKAAEKVEVEPDAWERFERGVDALVKRPKGKRDAKDSARRSRRQTQR